MEPVAIIFVSFLLVIGICFVLVVRNDFKKSARAAAEIRERAFSRQSRLPQLSSRQAVSRVRAIARKQADPWKSVTPSLVSEAFENFYSEDKETSFDTSLVSAAFERFTEEMRAR
jgi:hypothetical protein